jgi:hypothetical protein
LTFEVDNSFTDDSLYSGLLLKGEPPFEVEPARKYNPYLVLLLGGAFFEPISNLKQDFISCPNGVIEIQERTASVGFLFGDALIGFLILHGLFDTGEIFLVLNV